MTNDNEESSSFFKALFVHKIVKAYFKTTLEETTKRKTNKN